MAAPAPPQFLKPYHRFALPALGRVSHFDEVSERRKLLFLREKKPKDFASFSGPDAGRGLRMKGKSSLVLSLKKERSF
jgi:hypothetical protein